MTSGDDHYRKFFGDNDILSPSIYIPVTSRTLTTCPPEVAHSFVGVLTNDQNVPGVAFYSVRSNSQNRGGLLVSGEKKDGTRASVILHLRRVERQRALKNNLEPGVVYAELKTAYDQRAIKMSATTELILPMLQEPDEPAT